MRISILISRVNDLIWCSERIRQLDGLLVVKCDDHRRKLSRLFSERIRL